MRNVIEIECPPELLIGLHTNAEQFAERIKREAAYGLFREGTISSNVAARWLGVPRAHFLMDAMRHGAALLDNSEDDFRRETCGTSVGGCARAYPPYLDMRNAEMVAKER